MNKQKEKNLGPTLTVIIPTFNSADTLYFTLSSLFSSSLPRKLFQVVVVDYKSVDGTIDIAKRFPVRTLSAKKKGAAAARNLGTEKANGKIICFTDSDCVVPKDWLKKILCFLHNHPDVDGVGGPMLPHGYQNKIQRFAGETFLQDHVWFFSTKIIRVQPKLTGFLLLHTTNCAYRKSVLDSVGGFDESFFTACEDLELTWNLAYKGRNLVFNPNIKMRHIFPRTLPSLFNQYFRYGIGHSKMNKKYIHRNLIKEIFLIITHLLNVYYTFFRSLLSPRRMKRTHTYDLFRFCKWLSYDIGRIYEYARA